MENMLKKIPVPVGGLVLALAAAGNMVLSYGTVYRGILGIMAGFILLLFLIKLFTDYSDIRTQLKNPLELSMAPTFAMSLMLLAAYTKPYFGGLAFGVWVFAILLHGCLIAVFTVKYIFSFDINKVFASYFIVYVGIVTASVTAPVFGQSGLGRGIFWFGFIAYLFLLPVVLYRLFITKGIPEKALPSAAICAVPASLCLAGYLKSFNDKSAAVIAFLGILSLIMYLGVLLYLPRLLKIKFYPSYSSFTFPLVISAIAMKQTDSFLMKAGSPIYVLKYIAGLQQIIALVMIFYVLWRYIRFVLAPKEKAAVEIRVKSE